MDFIDSLVSVTEFFKNNKLVTNEMLELFGDSVPFDIMRNISKNRRLFRIYKKSDCKKFISALDALDATTNNVLIYITELKLYGVFSIDDYYVFIKEINGNEDGIEVNLYQVVVSTQRQKLVFVCDSESENVEVLEKVKKFVKQYYESNISTQIDKNKIEITVLDKVINSTDEARELFKRLCEFVYKKDRTIADKISPIRTYRERDHKYILPKLDINIDSVEELIKILKSAHTIIINAPIVIGNNNNNIVNKVASIKEDKYAFARNWIKKRK